MEWVSLLFLAVALAMDAFGVSITDGIVLRKIRIGGAVKIGLFFGAFQFIMPLIGSFLASVAENYIDAFDHWIAFGLLVFLGAKMIIDSFKKEEEIPKNPLGTGTLFVMAIATSIDALAAGITLPAITSLPILVCSAVIGAVAFVFSFAGMYIGARFGDIVGERADMVGGIVLILIGVKTLIQHLIEG